MTSVKEVILLIFVVSVLGLTVGNAIYNIYKREAFYGDVRVFMEQGSRYWSSLGKQ